MAKHPIDTLFENKLKGFEQKPSKNLWQDLEGQLDEKVHKKEKRRLVVWLSVAATILILAVAVWQVWNKPQEGTFQKNLVKENQKKNILKKPKNQEQEEDRLEKNSIEKIDNIEKNLVERSEQKTRYKPLETLPQKKNTIDTQSGRKPTLKVEKDTQLVQNTKESNTEKVDKIQVVVKVKLNKTRNSTNTILAQKEPEKKRKALFGKLKSLKNGEQSAGSIKLFESSGRRALEAIDK